MPPGKEQLALVEPRIPKSVKHENVQSIGLYGSRSSHLRIRAGRAQDSEHLFGRGHETAEGGLS